MTDLYYQKGLDSIKEKNYEKAVSNFTEVLKLEESSSAYSNRAFAYYRLNKKDLSKSDFEKSIEVTKANLDASQYKDPVYVDKSLIEIVRSKSSIAQINIEQRDLAEAEMDYTLILGIYKIIKDDKLIPNELHICHTYKNRGAIRYKLNKTEDAARDIAAAYIESNNNDVRIEIVDFAAVTGLTDEVKEYIKIYSMLKKNQ